MSSPGNERGRPVAGLDVSRETLDRLEIFADLLHHWNLRINMVSAGDLPHLWSRHIADSLQLAPLLPKVSRAVDLGSGAGFPAIPLAIATGLAFELLESDHRKAAFLREAARATAAPVTVHATRAESAAVRPAPLVTARALAGLTDLLSLADRLLAPGGVCLFPKGARVEAELTEAGKQWHMRVERFPSRIDPTGVILRISEISRVRDSPQNAGDREPEGRRG